MIAVSYLVKRKINKIFIDVIYNTKILLNEIAKDQDFTKLTGKTKKRELDNSEYGIKNNVIYF